MNQIDLVTHHQLVSAEKALREVLLKIDPAKLETDDYISLRLAQEYLVSALGFLEALPISGAQ